MFVMTAKLSKTKLLAAGLILLAAILLIVLLTTSGDAKGPELPASGATDEERAAFLATFGWSVDAKPKQAQNVRIPENDDNKVFARYNALQKSQGFDLTKFAGAEVTRYVYEILNYPNATAPVYASVLVHEGKIIGGDITDSAPNGVIHGFQKPSFSPTEPTDPTDCTVSTETTAATESSQCAEPSTSAAP